MPPLPIPAEPGEHIVWYGEPDTRLRLRWRHWAAMLFGTLGLGLSLTLVVALGGNPPRHGWQVVGAWLFTLVILGGSVALWVGPVVDDRQQRRRTRYWLTNRRAIIWNKRDPQTPRTVGPQDDPLRAAGFWISRLSPDMPLRRWHRTVRFAWRGWRYQEYRGKVGVGFDRVAQARRLKSLMAELIQQERSSRAGAC